MYLSKPARSSLESWVKTRGALPEELTESDPAAQAAGNLGMVAQWGLRKDRTEFVWDERSRSSSALDARETDFCHRSPAVGSFLPSVILSCVC